MLTQPLFFEVGDMPEIPDHGTQNRNMLFSEGFPVESRDQTQSALAYPIETSANSIAVENIDGMVRIRHLPITFGVRYTSATKLTGTHLVEGPFLNRPMASVPGNRPVVP